MREQKKAHSSKASASDLLYEKLKRGELVLPGMLAVSRAGHDKGTLYLVLCEEGPYLWLTDGRLRTLERPKKKKRMHTQVITHLPAGLADQIDSVRMDSHVRRVLRQYLTGESPSGESPER